jgi:hypothetical protein
LPKLIEAATNPQLTKAGTQGHQMPGHQRPALGRGRPDRQCCRQGCSRRGDYRSPGRRALRDQPVWRAHRLGTRAWPQRLCRYPRRDPRRREGSRPEAKPNCGEPRQCQGQRQDCNPHTADWGRNRPSQTRAQGGVTSSSAKLSSRMRLHLAEAGHIARHTARHLPRGK